MSWSGQDPSAWAENAEKLMEALLKNSVQDLAQEAAKTRPNGGLVPVKTGNLGRSVVVDNKPPSQDIPGIEHEVQQDISGGIGAIELGKPVYVGWQANYSRRVNYGFVGADSLGRVYNQSGAGFAEATAAMWPQIVMRQAAKLKR